MSLKTLDFVTFDLISFHYYFPTSEIRSLSRLCKAIFEEDTIAASMLNFCLKDNYKNHGTWCWKKRMVPLLGMQIIIIQILFYKLNFTYQKIECDLLISTLPEIRGIILFFYFPSITVCSLALSFTLSQTFFFSDFEQDWVLNSKIFLNNMHILWRKAYCILITEIMDI